MIFSPQHTGCKGNSMQSKLNIQWNHAHSFELDNQHKAKKVQTVFWLTTVVMVLEIIAGTLTGSMALLADGWHMGTHSAAFALTLFVYWYAKKHAHNRDFSFGTGKVNYLGGFASAITLAIVALMMIIESVQRLITPLNIHFNQAILVAIIGLAVNIVSVVLLSDDHHHHEHHQDHNMRAAYMHVLADTLTSVLAIVALISGKYFGLIWMDALMGIVGAVIILRWSYGLLKESSSVLLDKTINQFALTEIAECLKSANETMINDLHVWKIAQNYQAIIISVVSKNPLQVSEYKHLLKQYLPARSHITIEVNKN